MDFILLQRKSYMQLLNGAILCTVLQRIPMDAMEDKDMKPIMYWILISGESRSEPKFI